MRLFHSIWSLPQHSNRWNIPFEKRRYCDVLCAALSVVFAKGNGCKIVLHADNEGVENYGWLPYDEIHATLEGFNYNPIFWAAGKILAHEAEPLGSIQIDTDVFIRWSSIVDTLNQLKNHDLIIQHFCLEKDIVYYLKHNTLIWHKLLEANVNQEVPFFQFQDKRIAASCGLVGFNNQMLKDLFIDTYKKLYHLLKDNTDFFDEVRDKSICLDLLLEEYNLGYCTKILNNSVLTVLPNGWENKLDDVPDIGYTHLVFKKKYKIDVIQQCEQLLQELAPEIWTEFTERFGSLRQYIDVEPETTKKDEKIDIGQVNQFIFDGRNSGKITETDNHNSNYSIPLSMLNNNDFLFLADINI